MVRSLNGCMNVAGAPEQLSIDCSSNCSIAQIGVMSNCPPFRGALLTITRLHHSLLNTPAINLYGTEQRAQAC
jgi:hypothetical protein